MNEQTDVQFPNEPPESQTTWPWVLEESARFILDTTTEQGTVELAEDLQRIAAALRSDSPVSEHADDCASGLGGPCDCHVMWSEESDRLPASTGGERDEPRIPKEAYTDEAFELGIRSVLEDAVPVVVRYGRQGGFDIMPNDLPKRWVRDNTDEWIPAWLTPRNLHGDTDE